MPTNTKTALARLEAVHSREVVGIASMHHLCKHLLEHYCRQNGVDSVALVRKLDECVDSHLFDRDITQPDYAAAMTDLVNTGRRVTASVS